MKRRRHLPEHVWERIEVGDCWNWTSWLSSMGYGVFNIENRQRLAHRFVWELLVGPIAPGLHLDHLCRNRRCVNPDHLEPVTPRENTIRNPYIRKQRCKWGHSLADAFVRRTGGRNCRTCVMESTRRRRAAARAAA